MQPKPAEESYFNEVEISTIDGVSLGMSPVEVTLLKGQAENSSEKINVITTKDVYVLGDKGQTVDRIVPNVLK